MVQMLNQLSMQVLKSGFLKTSLAQISFEKLSKRLSTGNDLTTHAYIIFFQISKNFLFKKISMTLPEEALQKKGLLLDL